MSDRDIIWLLLQLGSVGFAAGLVVMQVKSLNQTVEKVSARLEELAVRVGKHGEKLARLETVVRLRRRPRWDSDERAD